MTNEDTLFQCYHLESSAQIVGFLKVEITNYRSKFHHLERDRSNYDVLAGDVNGDNRTDLIWNETGDINRTYVGLSDF
ncbi:hypothetical protein LC612_28165 [Nostoc sp. CHAB 5834]|nr:hypothetical protein [Nostoc sp. CHAB 5834]